MSPPFFHCVWHLLAFNNKKLTYVRDYMLSSCASSPTHLGILVCWSVETIRPQLHVHYSYYSSMEGSNIIFVVDVPRIGVFRVLNKFLQ